MTRNLKLLGLALVAVLAMSAMVASTASATVTKFTSVAGASIENRLKERQPKFKFTNLEITCEDSEYTGEVPANEFTEITVTPAYIECKTSLGTAVTVTGFGQHGESSNCYFVLNASGTADLECEGGAEVTIDAATCVIHIPPQNNLNKVTYTTVDTLGVEALTEHIELDKVKETHTDGVFCPLSSGGTTETGVFDFTTELWATDSKGAKVKLTDHTIK